MAKKSVDLTTLSGWANLSGGNHTIKIVAKGTGYSDSEKSAGVEVFKGYTDCLTFTGIDSEFTLTATNTSWWGTLEWSTDHINWRKLQNVVGESVTMQSLDKKLYLRGKNNNRGFYRDYQGVEFVLSAKAYCKGNIQTLIDWENPPSFIPTYNCYDSMFSGCTNLISAPELPATSLNPNCYQSMFSGCTNLISAPELPATSLLDYCYSFMFRGCTNLISAPELPATTLAEYCYLNMFQGCTNLTSAPELPATTLAYSCYGHMFEGCTNLISAPELPATTLADYCYSNMFQGCTSLTTAPELPATTLAKGCYGHMFKGCTKLKVNDISGNKIFTCPSSIPTDAVKDMFTNTGGEFTAGTPTAGNTYYYTV